MTSLLNRIKGNNRREENVFDASENRLNDNLEFQEMQWYERNPLRLEREKNELEESYPNLTIQNLNDARLCCSGSLKIIDREIPIYIIYPYLYPLEPFKCYFDLNEQFNDIVSEDGSVALFEIPNFSWDSRKTIKDTLNTLINYFTIRIQLKNQEGQIKDDETK